MKKLILCIFLLLGVFSLADNYKYENDSLLRLHKLNDKEYVFWLTYDTGMNGKTWDEIGAVKKEKGNTYSYEGISYGETCKIQMKINKKNVKVETNGLCSAMFNGDYKYSGKTSKEDVSTIIDVINMDTE